MSDRWDRVKYYSHFPRLHVPMQAADLGIWSDPILWSWGLHFYGSKIARECTDHQFLPEPQCVSVYVDCVQILCPQTKLKHTLRYRFPLGQTSVSLGNVENLRALTSPLNLKNEQGPWCPPVWYIQVPWIHFQGSLTAVGVDGEEWSWEVGAMVRDNCKAVRSSFFKLCEMYLKAEAKPLFWIGALLWEI